MVQDLLAEQNHVIKELRAELRAVKAELRAVKALSTGLISTIEDLKEGEDEYEDEYSLDDGDIEIPTTLWVDPHNGDNSNSGLSIDKAFRTVNRALSMSSFCDTLVDIKIVPAEEGE